MAFTVKGIKELVMNINKKIEKYIYPKREHIL